MVHEVMQPVCYTTLICPQVRSGIRDGPLSNSTDLLGNDYYLGPHLLSIHEWLPGCFPRRRTKVAKDTAQRLTMCDIVYIWHY